ncbi:MAG: hypothetical protein JSS86_00350, partial [Cyanobacteria bacterium SZAS LIN-2]|nr:hypothetical protein [Cyanobacteria bacterium SZAS LIN-2]
MRRLLTKFLLLTAVVCMAPVAWHPASGADKRTDAINLYNARDYRGAAALLDDYLAVNNRDPYAAYYAAMAHQQTGNVNKARMYYRQVYTLSPNSQIGGFAKNILLKLDPSFAASLPKTTTTSASSSGSNVSSSASSATASAPAFDPSLPGECNIPYDKSNSG